ncbi:EmrB/QacA family drug resistance transporter [Pseudomonas putida S11]|nr:EmrB/QacA family drug resistance transporter [Pseudomonas putida S11]
MSNNAAAQFTPPSLLLTTIGLSLATFMQVLDTTIANVALPTISGNLGVSYEQGTWVITSFAVSNAIALPLTGWRQPTVWRGEAVHLGHAAVRAGLVPVRYCPVDAGAGRFSRVAGCGGRAVVPDDPDFADRRLSPGQARHGPGAAGDGHGGGADCRADSRRLDNRQLQLALDLLHQRAHRPVRRRRGPPADAHPAGGHQPPADGLHRPADADHRRWRLAGGAGQRQRPGLVRIVVHHRRKPGLAGVPGGVRDLGTDRPSPGGQPAPVRAPQLPRGHHRAGRGLCRVLRHQPDPASVAADADGLYRYLGRPGGGADRPVAGADVAVRGQVRPPLRPACAGRAGVPGDRQQLLHACRVHQRGGLPACGAGAVVHGYWRCAVLHADLEHPAVRPATAADRRWLGPGDLPAYLGRQFRGIADHLDLDSPGGPAPCLPERAHQPVRPGHAAYPGAAGRGQPAELCAAGADTQRAGVHDVDGGLLHPDDLGVCRVDPAGVVRQTALYRQGGAGVGRALSRARTRPRLIAKCHVRHSLLRTRAAACAAPTGRFAAPAGCRPARRSRGHRRKARTRESARSACRRSRRRGCDRRGYRGW